MWELTLFGIEVYENIELTVSEEVNHLTTTAEWKIVAPESTLTCHTGVKCSNLDKAYHSSKRLLNDIEHLY